MQARCVGDTAICKALYHFSQPDGYSAQAIELEHRVAPICDRITADSVPFDRAAAEQRHEQWNCKLGEREAKLQTQFPGTNLNSRAQIGALLEARGWVPKKRTEKTKQPCIDDEVLETIPRAFSRIRWARRIRSTAPAHCSTCNRKTSLAETDRRRWAHSRRAHSYRNTAW